MKREHANRTTCDPLGAAAATIVKYRFVFFFLFAAAAVFCFFSIGKVRINDDITSFLPPDTETKRGIVIMENEFETYASAEVMVSGVTFGEACALRDAVSALEHVAAVEFGPGEDHFRDSSALFSVSFDEPAKGEGTKAAMQKIDGLIAQYEHYVSTPVIGNYSEKLAGEMLGIMIIAAAVIAAVLLLTSRSWFEPVIFATVFAFAALLNMGTNFLLGEISSITNSIAVIMQLALAIDYAIIFSHRYQDEAELGPDDRTALVRALKKSIAEIASSCLTTVSGLIALMLMQFRMGYDLGAVLAKGIVCSMLTVFLLMPGLIALFPRVLKKTKHRKLVPNIEGWGRLLTKKVPVFLILFALLLPFAVIFSSKTDYAFSAETVTEIIPNEERRAARKIREVFGERTAVALLVPAGDYESERELLSEVSAFEGVVSSVGIADVVFDGEHRLTDPYTPEMLSELSGTDVETVGLLFRYYRLTQLGKGRPAAGEEEGVPLIDLLICLMGLVDQGVVPVSEEQARLISELRPSLERGVSQLKGENYDRLVFVAGLPVEGDVSVALTESIRSAAEAKYGKGNVLVIGDITSARDLRESYKSDSVLISLLTVLFVFVILLFTFKSPVAAAILVFVIQGSIWINFSFPHLTGARPLFVTNMIVSAIQMGATIDYAIVIMSRYKALRALYPKKDAMAKAVNESFPTVLTSGAIMMLAGFLIGLRVSDVYVGHIGLAVGRGALISVVLVLTVLPQMILLFDKPILKTTFRLPSIRKQKTESERGA